MKLPMSKKTKQGGAKGGGIRHCRFTSGRERGGEKRPERGRESRGKPQSNRNLQVSGGGGT